MKKLVLSALFAGMVALLPNPAPADAQAKLVKCINEQKETCDADFPGGDFYSAAIRGYCYTIRSAICWAFD